MLLCKIHILINKFCPYPFPGLGYWFNDGVSEEVDLTTLIDYSEVSGIDYKDL